MTDRIQSTTADPCATSPSRPPLPLHQVDSVAAQDPAQARATTRHRRRARWYGHFWAVVMLPFGVSAVAGLAHGDVWGPFVLLFAGGTGWYARYLYRAGSFRFLIIPNPWIQGKRSRGMAFGRSAPAFALVVAMVVLAGCFNSDPTTKAALCEKFDALGKELLTTHILSDNAVFRRAGDLADAAGRYEASGAVKAEAKRIQKIADSDETSGVQLLNATRAVADVCGHPLGIGGDGWP